jgi:hypothetical protein
MNIRPRTPGQLVEALKRQELIGGDVTIAQAFADAGELIEYPKGHAIITQDAHDNDVFFIIAGSTASDDIVPVFLPRSARG